METEKHQGPSIIITYSLCISLGIVDIEKLAVESGYFQIFRYDSDTKDFNLDYKNVNFDK